MKTMKSVVFLTMLVSNTFGFGEINPSTLNDDNSIYPPIIGAIMVIGSIIARLIATRKKAH